jgi:hypothetical protein
MTTLHSKLCVLSLVGISLIAPLNLLNNTGGQSMGHGDYLARTGTVVSQWSTFEVPADLGLPHKREPGGTR